MDTEAINNRPTFAKISCKVGRGRQPYRGALVNRDKILPVLVNFRWILAKPETRNNPSLVRNKIMSSLHFCSLWARADGYPSPFGGNTNKAVLLEYSLSF